jgi:hypothetical protein
MTLVNVTKSLRLGMDDHFQALIDKYRARMAGPREAFERGGCLVPTWLDDLFTAWEDA